jgi:hypothetical protein
LAPPKAEEEGHSNASVEHPNPSSSDLPNNSKRV